MCQVFKNRTRLLVIKRRTLVLGYVHGIKAGNTVYIAHCIPVFRYRIAFRLSLQDLNGDLEIAPVFR